MHSRARTRWQWRLSLAIAATLFTSNAYSHTCPPDAAATGVGVTVTALRTNRVPVGSGSVAPCEPLILQMSILYFEIDPITLGKNAAFEGGAMNLRSPGRFDADVTPLGGVPLMGGNGTPGCAGQSFLASRQVPYVVTEADAAAGSFPVLATYTNGNAHIGDTNLDSVVSGTQGFTVRVRPGATCSIAPQSQTICAGGSATFTASGTNGTAPYTFQWRGPNGFTTNGPTLTINNAQPSRSGTYTVTIRDFFGCTNTCSAVLTVNPAPICSITGPTNVCHPATNQFTSVVTPKSLNPTHKWTITGSGAIVGADNQPTVSVRTTGSGSYTLTSTVSANGCTNVCTRTVSVRICDARILLVKEVVCWTPDGCAPFTGADTAVGIKSGNQCPAFCYRITIRNDSPPGVEIRNVVVTDNQLDLGDCDFPSTLTAVGTPGASFSCIISNVTHCQDIFSRATVNGTGVDAATGAVIGPVTTNDTTRVTIVPISVVCEKTVSSPDDMEAGTGVTLPADNAPHAVTYGVSVRNPSTVPLIVHITDPALQNCPLPQEFSTGVPIAAGQTLAWPEICTAMLQCGVEPLVGPFTNTIMVTAVVDTSLTNLCPFASDGTLIAAASSCPAVVDCGSGVGAGTPGYWINHPEAWPVTTIVVGGRTYTRQQAIRLMRNEGGDKSITLFRHLVSAKLNLLIGTDPSCIQDTVAAADVWFVAHPPGSGVGAKTPAWKREGERLKNMLDAYNNGLLCAPHRD